METGSVILDPSDVLHVPGLGFDGLVGYSPIALEKSAIGLGIAAEDRSRISAGMKAEINRAKWKSYRLRYFTEDCQEV